MIPTAKRMGRTVLGVRMGLNSQYRPCVPLKRIGLTAMPSTAVAGKRCLCRGSVSNMAHWGTHPRGHTGGAPALLLLLLLIVGVFRLY